MALSSIDERDLLQPLHEGIREDPVWQTFLARLLARTRAQQVCLLVRVAGLGQKEPYLRRAAANRDDPVPDFIRLAELGLIPLAAMRPNRVYSLQETISPAEDELRERQRAELRRARMAQARMVRIRSTNEHEAWLVITHQQTDFGAGDSVLLSALAPHIAIALDTLALIDGLRLRAALAEDALDLLGIRQGALDREARLIGTGPELPGGRLPLSPRIGQEMADACTALAARPRSERRVVRTGDEDGADVLLRPCPDAGCALPHGGAAAAISRPIGHGNPASAARVLAQTLGLSATEAALAEGMARGKSILEAGAQLRLTPETARNYSKRIYAKTGATGQADLVRMVLSGLAPLA